MADRKTVFIIAFLVLTPAVLAIEVSVSSSCEGDEVAMISLKNTSGGHIAEPSYYGDNKVCVSGVESSAIRNGCNSEEQVVFSMEDKNNSHLSIYENEYLYQLCTPGVKSTVRTSCTANETKMLSVTSDNNTHAAAPGYTTDPYNQSVCLEKENPENITLGLSGLSSPIYADDTEISTGQSFTPPIGFPYIVSDQPAGIISRGSFRKISRPSSDTVSITQETSTGGFLIPFTSGGYEEVEGKESQVLNGEFLSSNSPNFGFIETDKPTLKVVYEPGQSIEGFSDTLGTGTNSFTISNLGLQGQNLTIQVKPE